MKEYFYIRACNLLLRSLSMLAKFLLIIYMAKYFGMEDIGQYGLFAITVALATFLLGLDFYTYNTRELLSRPTGERFSLIRNQFVFHLLVYTVMLPMLLLVFYVGIISVEFMLLFYSVLVFEHLSQELFRLYTTLSRPIFASVLLFIRTGLWVYVLIAIWLNDSTIIRDLFSIYTYWFIGSFVSAIIGIWYLYVIFSKAEVKENIDWAWIKKGLRISIPFFIGTIAYKVIEFSDRYMIDYYMSKFDVGVYTFYGSISGALQSVIFTLVIMMYYPKLIELYQHGKVSEFESKVKSFFWEVVLYSVVVSGLIIMFISPLLGYVEKESLENNLSVLWLLLGATFVLNLSFVPHYILYVKNKDILIRNITVGGALLNIALNIYLIQRFGLNGAAAATLISFGFMLFAKYYYSRVASH